MYNREISHSLFRSFVQPACTDLLLMCDRSRYLVHHSTHRTLHLPHFSFNMPSKSFSHSSPLSQAPRTVCDLIEEQASCCPDGVAVLFQGKSISYAELDLLSSRIAHLLQIRGVSRHHRVPVLTNRCPEMVACFLGVLKTGACYVPMDTDSWSKNRIRDTLSTASSRTVITTGTADYEGFDVVTLQDVRYAPLQTEDIKHAGLTRTDSLRPYICSSDLAYIIFTSGTTSAPKGVMIPHRALLNYVQHGGEQAPFNMNVKPLDRVLLTFSVAFDGRFCPVFRC